MEWISCLQQIIFKIRMTQNSSTLTTQRVALTAPLHRRELITRKTAHLSWNLLHIPSISESKVGFLLVFFFFPYLLCFIHPAIMASYYVDVPALIIVKFHCNVLDFIVNSVSTGRATTSTDTAAITFSSCYPLNLAFRSKRSHYLTNCHSLLFHFW